MEHIQQQSEPFRSEPMPHSAAGGDDAGAMTI